MKTIQIPDDAVIYVLTPEQSKVFLGRAPEQKKGRPATLREAAEFLGVSYRTIQRIKGKIGAYRLRENGSYFVDWKDLYNFKSNQKRRYV